MTTLASSTLFLNTANSTTGILINSHSRSSPNRHPSSIASSSSSHSTHSHSCSSSNDGGGTRKIRFAPLPAPRRDELPCVFYESDSDSQLLHNIDSPPPPITVHSEDPAPKLRSRTWGKLLRPLLHPLIPSAPNGDDSSCLSRISSRDSAPNDDNLGAPLTRRMSTGSRVVPTRETERLYRDGVPLAPVMSEGSASKGRKDGQRMLNGRVYGRRLSAVNHHQATYEPEFVEWGYGGMGSVSSGAAKSRSGPDWAKLQSTGKVLGADDRVDNEGDDGSGMGWVRKRRAQREREQREKEESERAAQNGDAVPDINVHSPAHVESESKPEEHHHIYRAVSIPAPYHHHVRHHSLHKSGEGSGTVTPTSIPPLSRAGSSNSVPLIRTASSGSTIPLFRTPSSSSPVPLFRTPSSGSAVPLFRTTSSGSHGETLLPMPENKEASSASPAASNASIDEDDDDSEDENDTERDSDEDDDSNDVSSRILFVDSVKPRFVAGGRSHYQQGCWC